MGGAAVGGAVAPVHHRGVVGGGFVGGEAGVREDEQSERPGVLPLDGGDGRGGRDQRQRIVGDDDGGGLSDVGAADVGDPDGERPAAGGCLVVDVGGEHDEVAVVVEDTELACARRPAQGPGQRADGPVAPDDGGREIV